MNLNREKSAQLFEEAKKMFPGGVHSPVRAFKSVEGPPLFIKKGKGAYITDADDNRYLDFCASWGPLILGHADEDVLNYVSEVMRNGLTFGAPSELGNQLGRIILDHHRYIEKIRFVSSGTEAVMSALRLARGYTNKSKIIKFEGCYHGHSDSLLVKAGSGLVTFGHSSSAGVPPSLIKDTVVVKIGDEEAVKRAFQEFKDDIAAIIIEPIPANNGLLIQDKSYLEFLRTITKDNQTLLIFDEVISGFRVGFEGAAGLYDIKPDIMTFGKIIGGGMPVGAFASSHDIMSKMAPDGDVYQAGTLSANPVAMAAGYATLKKLLQPNFYEKLSETTETFVQDILSQVDHPHFGIQNIGSIFWLKFSNERIYSPDQIDSNANVFFRKLHVKLLESGIYLGPSAYEVGFISDKHEVSDLKKTSEKCAFLLNNHVFS